MHGCTSPPPPQPLTHIYLKKEIEPEMKEVEKDSRDSRGISSWDRVDKLARALVNLSGLARSKRSSSHPTGDHMKRYFQSITWCICQFMHNTPIIVVASCQGVRLCFLSLKKQSCWRSFVCFSSINTMHQQRDQIQEESRRSSPPGGSSLFPHIIRCRWKYWTVRSYWIT